RGPMNSHQLEATTEDVTEADHELASPPKISNETHEAGHGSTPPLFDQPTLLRPQPSSISVLVPVWLRNLFHKALENDLESAVSLVESHEPKMDAVTASLTVSDAALNSYKAIKRRYVDYRDAEKQTLHAQRLSEQLRLIQTRLDALSPAIKEQIKPSQAALKDSCAVYPSKLQPKDRKGRLKWVLRGKRKFERVFNQSLQSESLLNTSLLSSLIHEM
ncbi:uncharacterized protein KY384_001626, partial [Bacidia gigantensis]|uniref:uncharacterized protein n=1 Tax=Bacidia gigantensis TaxID=2732470 RepID=UPI001D039B6B